MIQRLLLLLCAQSKHQIPSTMASNGRLGLSLQLPPEVVASLQSRNEIRVNHHEKSAAASFDNDDNNDSQEVHVEPIHSAESELWDDTIAVQPQFLDDVEKTSAGDQGDASEEIIMMMTTTTTFRLDHRPRSLWPLSISNDFVAFVRQVNKRRTNCAIKL